MLKTVMFITALTVTPVNPNEKPPAPPETVTITKELAEKLVQQSIAFQNEIARLKHGVYLYQMDLYDERNKMCA